jgi:hypothetical protein
MKKIKIQIPLLLILLVSLNIKSMGQDPNWLWANQTTGNGYSYAQDIFQDGNNNVYVCGYLMDSINFGNQSIVSNNQCAYVAKYNSYGLFQWVITFQSDISSFADRISVDYEENIIVAGYFNGTLNAGNFTLNTSASDIYLIKLDTNGNVLWAEQSVSNSYTQVHSIAVDVSNNIVVAGYCDAQTSFGNLVAYESGMFIVQYDSNGTPFHLINEYAFGCHSLDVKNGDIYISGAIHDTTIIENDTLYPTGYFTVGPLGDTTYIMNNDLVFISYENNGDVNWIKQATSKNHDLWTFATLDESSNYYICGEIGDTTNFWGTTLLPAGGSTPFLIKTDQSGNIIWSVTGEPVSSGGKLIFADIAIHEGFIYLLGYPFQSSSFANLVISNNYYIYSTMILKLDTDGNGVWQIFDSTNYAHNKPSSIVIDNLDNISVCGYFEDTVHFGSNYLYSLGGQTMYLAQVPSEPVAIEEQDYEDYESFNIYPNPTNGEFTFDLPYEEAIINIYNSCGKLVKNAVIEKGTSEFQLQESGIYFINLIIGDKTYCQKIIVIQ